MDSFLKGLYEALDVTLSQDVDMESKLNSMIKLLKQSTNEQIQARVSSFSLDSYQSGTVLDKNVGGRPLSSSSSAHEAATINLVDDEEEDVVLHSGLFTQLSSSAQNLTLQKAGVKASAPLASAGSSNSPTCSICGEAVVESTSSNSINCSQCSKPFHKDCLARSLKLITVEAPVRCEVCSRKRKPVPSSSTLVNRSKALSFSTLSNSSLLKKSKKM